MGVHKAECSCSSHFLWDIKTNVLPSNNDHYLEFHHGVPAHLVSVGVRYWIHSNQLGFISNSDSVETWEEDCLRGSWETRWESQRVFVRLKKGTPLCICVGLVQITSFHVTIKARVYLSFSSCPCTFITGQTVVFGTTPRLRVQTESRTWFKKINKLKSGKYNFRRTGIWLRSGSLSPFLKGKQLFGKYERLTDRYPLKGHLLNSFACIVLGFTGFEWMFSSVLSTNVTVLGDDKTQLCVTQRKACDG